MHVIILSKQEYEILREYALGSPIKKVRKQAQAIILRDERSKISQIARILDKSERTITSWLKQFAIRRISSIFSGSIDNENACKLTKKQKEEIKALLGRQDETKSIPLFFWNVPTLKHYVKATFGVVYESPSSYHFLLKFSDFSFKYPDKRSPNRNEKEIKSRIVEIRREIKPLLKDPNTLVFAADEVRVQLEAEIRRCWLKKGKRAIIKTQRSKEHQNYIGFLNLNSHKVDLFPIEYGNSEQIVLILQLLCQKYPDKRIVVIWDNATWHKSKLLKEKLTKDNSLQKLHLINFPPYAPECNPIERVWNTTKSKLANKSEQSFAQIKSYFTHLIETTTFNYQI